jgi:hypothetical protein
MRSKPTAIIACLLLTLAAGLVRADEARPTLSFRRDVIAVLTKAGCNGGACHGSFQGRGGLRLSLLGFDPVADYDALVREARGRRVFPAAPEHSLMLTKPTGIVPHGGKKRLDPAEDGYRILRDWIVQGMPGPPAEDVTAARLEVTPAEAVLRNGEHTAVRVRAVWSDGRPQDATAWALYESTSDAVAVVSPSGQVTARGPGRAAITIRYLGQVAAVPVTVPFAASAGGTAAESSNFIDEHVSAEWKKLGLKPAPLADDAEFVRRVSLDLVGTLPTPDEVRRFLAAKEPDKRATLIDALLERPEYVDYWSLKWSDLLRAHRRALGEKGLTSFNGWLRQALRENRPFDRVARQLLTAQGNLYTSGPVAFYFVDRTPEDLAETTAQVFLGVRLQCAKCHHHPFEVWSQDDYYGLAAFFARVQRKDNKDDGGFGGAQAVRLGESGQVVFPGTNRVVPPRVLGQAVPVTDAGDPRPALAEWLTRKDNPYFARNVVNRYWGYLFGRGLVEPIDDLRATNPASHPALLDALARDFADNGYDLKRLLRTLCRSQTYQRAAELAPQRDVEGMFFTHHRPRRLPAEVLLDAINQAAGTDEAFAGMPAGTRAIALPDPAVDSSFLTTFGRPRRTSTCECERGSRPDLGQALHLANSEKLHQKVTSPQGRVARLLVAKRADAEIIEELYLATLSRLPTAEERARVHKLLASASSRQEGLEDLLWALLNTAEFSFNH